MKIEELKVGMYITCVNEDENYGFGNGETFEIKMINDSCEEIIIVNDYNWYEIYYDDLPFFEKEKYDHQTELTQKWFNEIDNKPEFRLVDERRQQIKLNDVIKFTCIESGEKVLRKVVGLNLVTYITDFEEDEDGYSRIGFGNSSYTHQVFTSCYIKEELAKIYSKEQIEKYGLIAIHTERLK